MCNGISPVEDLVKAPPKKVTICAFRVENGVIAQYAICGAKPVYDSGIPARPGVDAVNCTECKEKISSYGY